MPRTRESMRRAASRVRTTSRPAGCSKGLEVVSPLGPFMFLPPGNLRKLLTSLCYHTSEIKGAPLKGKEKAAAGPRGQRRCISPGRRSAVGRVGHVLPLPQHEAFQGVE